MTPDQLAFLNAICSNPDEDTHRLVYADWLEENAGTVPCKRCEGDGKVIRPAYDDPGPLFPQCSNCDGTGTVPDGNAERAEFIRVQVELSRKYGDNPSNPRSEWDTEGLWSQHPDAALVRRERELFHIIDFPCLRPDGPLHGVRLTPAELDVCELPVKGLVSRGFVSAITCTAESWLWHADAVVWHPEQTVECRTCDGRGGWQSGPRCPSCNGTGRVTRPFPETAQPITRVTLTTEPDERHMNEYQARWHWIEFIVGGEVWR